MIAVWIALGVVALLGLLVRDAHRQVVKVLQGL